MTYPAQPGYQQPVQYQPLAPQAVQTPFNPQADLAWKGSDDNPEAFVVFLKSGKGHEATSLTIRGSNLAELGARLGEVEGSDILTRIAKLNADFRAVDAVAAGFPTVEQVPGPPFVPDPPQYATGGPISPPQQGAGAPNSPQGYTGTPPAVSAPSGVQAPVCAHGPRIWATGDGKNGRAWYAWDCSAKGGSYACEQDRLWAKKDGGVSARN